MCFALRGSPPILFNSFVHNSLWDQTLDFAMVARRHTLVSKGATEVWNVGPGMQASLASTAALRTELLQEAEGCRRLGHVFSSPKQEMLGCRKQSTGRVIAWACPVRASMCSGER